MPKRPNGYKWWALSATSVGMLMAVLNSTTLLIALPTLTRVLHMSTFLAIWVLLVYMVVQTALVLTVGRLSDVWGRKKLYVAGFAIFTVAALLAGLAPNGLLLLVIRGIQAIGGAMVMGNSTAIVTDAFPRHELGLALGINSIVIALGQVLGPILGGLLVTWFSWHWIFWFNVPIGIVGTLWAWKQLQDVVPPAREPALDYRGNITYIVSLVALLMGVTAGGIMGWTQPLAVGALLMGALGAMLFIRLEKTAAYPLLSLSLFENRVFLLSNLANFFIAMVRGAVILLFVFYFQGARGDSPLEAGLLVIPLAAAMGVIGPISGWLADHIGPRVPASLGALCVAIGFVGFGITLHRSTGYGLIAVWMILVGFGNGLFNSPNTSTIMGAVSPQSRGVAAGIRTMLFNTGGVFAIALVMALIASRLPSSVMMAVLAGETARISTSGLENLLLALRSIFLILAIIALAAALFSWIPARRQDPTPTVSRLSHTRVS
ncbi:major facilitator superfamily MFS_1 [Sulfobacillus acidophilus DSM 10332]|uniref:Major facilitator superfamily MFS_1 n=1 Tax=Sulfobacillus acidophilus (strain ATCC 700253 / DSM 10332 / NAL) TaxID=679936 RepID=G8TVS8_SULAD|nr:major facilitator superfamily MFS_1 [Sulfobacillus acidophilus DSM 10332]